MPLMERHRRAGEQGRPGYAVFETGRTLRKKRGFWARLFVYALLLALVTALGGFAYLSASVFDEAGDEPSEQQAAVEQEEVPQETATEEEEAVSPAPEDAIGGVYSYRVSEFLRVAPGDTWVTEPVKGRDVVSLQTCIENLNDLFTL